jgi:hypothetical protein
MEEYLRNINCPLTESFLKLDSHIKSEIKERFGPLDLDSIISELEKEHNFSEKLYSAKVKFENKNTHEKIFKKANLAPSSCSDFNYPSSAQLIKYSNNEQLAEFIASQYNILNLKQFIKTFRELFNIESKSFKEEMDLNLVEFVDRFEQKLNQEQLKELKNIVQNIFKKELENILDKTRETDKFKVRYKNVELNYSGFFFKMRGHDLTQLFHKIFLNEGTINLFDMNSKVNINDKTIDNHEIVIGDFEKIGLFLPNEIREIFSKLTNASPKLVNEEETTMPGISLTVRSCFFF